MGSIFLKLFIVLTINSACIQEHTVLLSSKIMQLSLILKRLAAFSILLGLEHSVYHKIDRLFDKPYH